MTEQEYIKSLQADAAHLSRSYDLLFETHQREMGQRGQLENALADILEHPDASRGIQNIARAALGLSDEQEPHE